MFQLHILPTGFIPSIKSNVHCVFVHLHLTLDSFFVLVKTVVHFVMDSMKADDKIPLAARQV